MGDPDEDIIRNIPASVVSDLLNIDKAIELIVDQQTLLNIDDEVAEKLLDAVADARSALIYLAEKHDQLTVKLQEHTMENGEGFILDTPDQIAAFGMLQVYYKLKLEVEHPNGPKWRESPLRQAIQILMRANIPVDKRTRKWVFPTYRAYLVSIGVLRADG